MSDSDGAAPPFIGAAELTESLGYAGAIAALERGFAGLGAASPPAIERDRHVVDGGELLVMPAAGAEGVGVKLVTLAPGNPERGRPLIHGVYVLFAPESMQPEALFDGAALTALRTASVSAVATKHLARPEAHRLVVFGAGTQAAAHAHAIAQVRAIDEVVIVGRGRERATELVERLSGAGLPARLGSADAVADADIVCTCTTSPDPVFRGDRVAKGAHVNAVGAYRHDLRELEADLIARATLVVEQRAAAMVEAGDILQAIDEGAIGVDHISAELADVVSGRSGRTDPDEITIFKSVGLAVEDLIVARAALTSAQR